MVATLLVATILIAIIFLAQSLRFLDLVIDAGASGTSFWKLTMLVLPRFFEVILPISVMISVIFIYNRLISDNELVVINASGLSSIRITLPAIAFAGFLSLCLYFNAGWVAPKSLTKMEELIQIVRNEAASFLLKEGVFSNFSKDITAYIHNKTPDGQLEGLLIHDKRDKDDPPVTILAKRGNLITDEKGNRQVVVYEGSRQQFDPAKENLEKLEFNRYIINFPKKGEENTIRWVEPEERTFFDLVNYDRTDRRDLRFEDNLIAEIHRRITNPFLVLTFTAVSLSIMLTGSFERRGTGVRILLAAVAGILIQTVFLLSFNLAKQTDVGIYMMYIVVFLPFFAGLFALTKPFDLKRLVAGSGQRE